MTEPARRVLLIFLAATALVRPFIGLALVGRAGTTWTVYRDFESVQKGRAA